MTQLGTTVPKLGTNNACQNLFVVKARRSVGIRRKDCQMEAEGALILQFVGPTGWCRMIRSITSVEHVYIRRLTGRGYSE